MKYRYARASTEDRNAAMQLKALNRAGCRGVKFPSLTEAIDTETPTGRAMWQMIGVLAELERSLITERTHAGIQAAKRRGVKFGRKPKLTPQQTAHARKLIKQGEAPQSVASLLRVSRATVYRALRVMP
jgi:DNA invertase Pin-like site-specific DNA recombinase